MVTMKALDLKMSRDCGTAGTGACNCGRDGQWGCLFYHVITTLDSLHLNRELYYRDYRFAEVLPH